MRRCVGYVTGVNNSEEHVIRTPAHVLTASDCCYPYSCACPHSHNPHGHGPHSHNPHGHGPHRHTPHLHTPHTHMPHTHAISSGGTTAPPPSSSPSPPSPLTCASKGITAKCCYDGPSGQPEYVCGATSKCAKGQCLAATNSLCTDGPVATPDYVCSATQSCGRGVCVGATFTLCGTSGTTKCGATLTCCCRTLFKSHARSVSKRSSTPSTTRLAMPTIYVS
jgi:hypothetical protein